MATKRAALVEAAKDLNKVLFNGEQQIDVAAGADELRAKIAEAVRDCMMPGDAVEQSTTEVIEALRAEIPKAFEPVVEVKETVTKAEEPAATSTVTTVATAPKVTTKPKSKTTETKAEPKKTDAAAPKTPQPHWTTVRPHKDDVFETVGECRSKAGTKAAKFFASFKKGMTVGDAIKGAGDLLPYSTLSAEIARAVVRGTVTLKRAEHASK